MDVIDLRGGEAEILAYEDDSFALQFEAPADLTGAQVTFRFDINTADLILTQSSGLTILPGQGLDSSYNQIAKPGFSLIHVRDLTQAEWDAMIAAGNTRYELRYELPGPTGDKFTPWRGKVVITKRID